MQEVLVGGIVNRVIVDIRKKCFRHALSLDYQPNAAAGPANLMSRITNGVEILAAGLRTVLDLVTRIVVSDVGGVAAIGSHEELLKTRSIYQRLYHSNKHQRAA